MIKLRTFLFLLILWLPVVSLSALQETAAPRLEITGVNASQMPTVTITANVYDNLGQPMRGLGMADFMLNGDLAAQAQITNVENISDDNLPFATVLLIDTSTSMIGTPIERARQAAHAFVDNIGDNDPVAIMTFDTTVVLAQDYTTDKAALGAVIDSLQAGGVTALYQGAYDAVQRAAASPTPRRAVVLLSDGAEYGDQSQVGRDAAAQEAVAQGVPVYTIGLGFGIDRSYLQQLSTSTNARFYESPTPEQLTQIYTDLAALLRSQYVITLDAPLPLDGTQYDLQLVVSTPQGSASATAALRAPIPVPIVHLPDLITPLTEPTDVTATVLADDPIASVTFQVDDRDTQTLTEPPYTITINPVDYAPGDYLLKVIATDADGDAGASAPSFTIGALPSQISLSPDLARLGAIAQPQEVTVETSGQTLTTAVSVAFNDGEPTDLTAPYSFTIDPIRFAPGASAVTVSVTNAGGVTAEQTFAFTVAAVSPQVTIVGLQDGQSVAAPVEFTVQVTAQEDNLQINASAGTVTLQPDADGAYTIDPMQFTPGAKTLVVTATTSGGRSGTARVNFIVAPLPPQIIVSGLTAGETLTQDRDVALDFITQSPVIHVAIFVDGVDLAHEVRAPYSITLRVLDFAPGEHTLRLVPDDADGQSTTLDIPFSIAPEPAATATATTILATQAALATATQQAVSTSVAVQATQVAQVTRSAQATGTVVQATLFAQSTTVAVQATQAAQATGTQFANATATTNSVRATAVAQAAQATGTQFANATATTNSVRATAAAQAAQATATQVANATATANSVQAAQNALNATATQNSINVTETQAARATATQVANATATANSVQAAQNALNATATENSVRATAAQATQTAQGALNNATATQIKVEAQATQAAQETATQGANALNATATQVKVEATANSVRATENSVRATATQAAVNATATRAAQATATSVQATRSVANSTATEAQAQALSLQATANSLRATSTQTALDATATANSVRATATQTALNATATANSVRATQARLLTATAARVGTQLANTLTAQQAQITSTAQVIQVTLTQQAVLQATGDARATQQAITQATGTAIVQATANSAATQTVLNRLATQTEQAADQATQGALDIAATQADANATATQVAQGTQNAQDTATQSVRATATQIAQATLGAQATMRSVIAAEAQQATRSALATANAQARLVAQATRDTRATRNAIATATQQANATASQTALAATATQAVLLATATANSVRATAEQATQVATAATAQAQQTLTSLEATATQFVVNATATRHALETQSAVNATATQTTHNATATVEATQTRAAQATQNAVATRDAVATQERMARITVTAQALANLATATANSVRATAGANSTLRANLLATDTQATQDAGMTATSNAQATLDTRLTAIGPTATPLGGGQQGAPTVTPQPSPTLTEVQAQAPPASSNLAPILIVLIVIIVIIIVLVLVMRGRGTPTSRP